MAGEYYDHTTYPASGAAGSSAAMRAELEAIQAGFDKLPALSGNANEVVVVNGSGAALTSLATLPVSAGGTGAATITGLVKGNGTSAFTAAAAGTDYLAPAAIGVTVHAYDPDLASWAAITPSSKLDATGGTATSLTLNASTASGLTLNDGYTEEVYAVSGTTPALSPTNGSIQTWTLSGTSTPTAGTWAAGQSITLMIDDGTAYTIDWASVSVTWKTGGGNAPSLVASGYTVIQLWKVGSTIYGARVGDA